MAAPFLVRVAATPSALPELADATEAYLAAAGLPDVSTAKLLMALDEIAANIAAHAYADGEGWLELSAVVDGREAALTFRDGGRAFDPGTLAPANTAAALEDRPIGGLGILLVRRLMDRFDYVREDGVNRLTIALALTP